MANEITAKVLSVTSLAGSICHGSAINWSEDNRIAITTLKGIYILSLQVRPDIRDAKIRFERNFIPAPSITNQFDVDISRETLHEKLENNKELLYELMLDRSLSPAGSNQQNFKGYRMAKWSCKEATSNNKCLLASLTMDYRLEVYYYSGKSWQKMGDLSSMFYLHVKNRQYEDCIIPESEGLSEGESLYQTFKFRTYNLLPTEIVWTGLFMRDKKQGKSNDYSKIDMPTDKFSMIIAAMKSGKVVLWKILTSSYSSSAIDVLAIFDSEMGELTSIAWYQLNTKSGILVVGSHEGKIRAFLATIQWMGRMGVVNFKVETAIWIWNFADKLGVSQIGLQKSRENACYVVAGRGSYLLACELELKENNLLMKYQSFCVGCHRLPLTGNCQLNDNFLVCSADGCVQAVNLEITKAGLKINHQSLTFESLNPCQKALMGMSSSPNQVFVCTIGRQMGFFDHLVIKEPIDISVFTTASLDDTVKLMMNSNKKLNDIRDVLEHVRLFLTIEESFPSHLSQLTSMEVNNSEIPENLLMLARWWIKWSIRSHSKDNKEDLKHLREIEEILLKRQLLKWLRGTDTVSLNGCKSVHTACAWLSSRNDINPSEEALITKLTNKKHYKAFLKEHGLTEKCAICQENINLDNILMATCPKGHTFARCSMTLRICDQLPYKKCVSCDVLAQETNDKCCIFCAGEMNLV